MNDRISFSLWGSYAIYNEGALRNIELARANYPGFICRFYISATLDPKYVERIRNAGAEVVVMSSENSYFNATWRFLAALDESVNVCLSRDCDSRISAREAAAVKEWLESDFDVHIMRDHPRHKRPMLAGMWGCRNQALIRVGGEEALAAHPRRNKYGVDEEFLATIYPKLKHSALEHDSFAARYSGRVRQFPTPREEFKFVGEKYSATDVRFREWKGIRRHAHAAQLR